MSDKSEFWVDVEKSKGAAVCPYCQSKAEVEVNVAYGRERYSVFCSNKGCGTNPSVGMSVSLESAIEAWNELGVDPGSRKVRRNSWDELESMITNHYAANQDIEMFDASKEDFPSINMFSNKFLLATVSNGRGTPLVTRIMVATIGIGCITVKGGYESGFLNKGTVYYEYWSAYRPSRMKEEI